MPLDHSTDSQNKDWKDLFADQKNKLSTFVVVFIGCDFVQLLLSTDHSGDTLELQSVTMVYGICVMLCWCNVYHCDIIK